MKIMIKTIKSWMIVLAAVISFVLAGGDIAYADDNTITVTIPYVHVYWTNNHKVSDEFDYKLEALTDNTPMPDGTIDTPYIFTLKGNTSGELSFTYKKNGIYNYKLTAIIPEEHLQGYVYETRSFDIDVYIGYNEDNTYMEPIVVITDSNGIKPDILELDPGYRGSANNGSSSGGGSGGGSKGAGGSDADRGPGVPDSSSTKGSSDMSPTNISWIAMDQDGRYTYSFNPDGTPVGTISLAGLSKTGEESVDICVILLLLTALMCTYWILRDIHIKKDLFEKNQITMTR